MGSVHSAMVRVRIGEGCVLSGNVLCTVTAGVTVGRGGTRFCPSESKANSDSEAKRTSDSERKNGVGSDFWGNGFAVECPAFVPLDERWVF